jgi:flagellar hook-associated protein 1 FlgK
MPGDLFSILATGSNSLAAHRAAAATASHNIENANTPGYARQRAELEATLPADDTGWGNLGRGVSLMNVTQTRDKFLEHQMPVALGNQARSSAEADTLESVSALDPDSANGLAATLGQFYAAIRGLSQNPGDRGLRQTMVAAGQSMSLAFNQAYHALETSRDAVDAKLEDVVGEVNRASEAIAELNKQIRGSIAGNSLPNDLMDARQRHIDTLARLTGAKAVESGNRTVSVFLPGGVALVTEFVSAPIGVRPNASNNGHLDITVSPTGGGVAKVLPADQLGGSTGGLLAARDGALLKAETDLDKLAYEFSNAFNTVHQQGYGLDAGTGRDFFTPLTQAAGASSLISVDAAIAANSNLIAAAGSPDAATGDNVNLLALVATEQQELYNGSDVGDILSRAVADFGATTAQARAKFEQDSHALSSLEGLRESASGVSIDEEMISLTKSQRAFEAVMKVITTADAMLDTLMKLR